MRGRGDWVCFMGKRFLRILFITRSALLNLVFATASVKERKVKLLEKGGICSLNTGETPRARAPRFLPCQGFTRLSCFSSP